MSWKASLRPSGEPRDAATAHWSATLSVRDERTSAQPSLSAPQPLSRAGAAVGSVNGSAISSVAAYSTHETPVRPAVVSTSLLLSSAATPAASTARRVGGFTPVLRYRAGDRPRAGQKVFGTATTAARSGSVGCEGEHSLYAKGGDNLWEEPHEDTSTPQTGTTSWAAPRRLSGMAPPVRTPPVSAVLDEEPPHAAPSPAAAAAPMSSDLPPPPPPAPAGSSTPFSEAAAAAGTPGFFLDFRARHGLGSSLGAPAGAGPSAAAGAASPRAPATTGWVGLQVHLRARTQATDIVALDLSAFRIDEGQWRWLCRAILPQLHSLRELTLVNMDLTDAYAAELVVNGLQATAAATDAAVTQTQARAMEAGSTARADSHRSERAASVAPPETALGAPLSSAAHVRRASSLSRPLHREYPAYPSISARQRDGGGRSTPRAVPRALPHLRRVNLSHNSLTHRSANHLGRLLLWSADTMEELRVAGNALGDYGMRVLGIYLAKLNVDMLAREPALFSEALRRQYRAASAAARGARSVDASSGATAAPAGSDGGSGARRGQLRGLPLPLAALHVGPSMIDLRDCRASARGLSELLTGASRSHRIATVLLSHNVPGTAILALPTHAVHGAGNYSDRNSSYLNAASGSNGGDGAATAATAVPVVTAAALVKSGELMAQPTFSSFLPLDYPNGLTEVALGGIPLGQMCSPLGCRELFLNLFFCCPQLDALDVSGSFELSLVLDADLARLLESGRRQQELERELRGRHAQASWELHLEEEGEINFSLEDDASLGGQSRVGDVLGELMAHAAFNAAVRHRPVPPAFSHVRELHLNGTGITDLSIRGICIALRGALRTGSGPAGDGADEDAGTPAPRGGGCMLQSLAVLNLSDNLLTASGCAHVLYGFVVDWPLRRARGSASPMVAVALQRNAGVTAADDSLVQVHYACEAALAARRAETAEAIARGKSSGLPLSIQFGCVAEDRGLARSTPDGGYSTGSGPAPSAARAPVVYYATCDAQGKTQSTFDVAAARRSMAASRRPEVLMAPEQSSLLSAAPMAYANGAYEDRVQSFPSPISRVEPRDVAASGAAGDGRQAAAHHRSLLNALEDAAAGDATLSAGPPVESGARLVSPSPDEAEPIAPRGLAREQTERPKRTPSPPGATAAAPTVAASDVLEGPVPPTPPSAASRAPPATTESPLVSVSASGSPFSVVASAASVSNAAAEVEREHERIRRLAQEMPLENTVNKYRQQPMDALSPSPSTGGGGSPIPAPPHSGTVHGSGTRTVFTHPQAGADPAEQWASAVAAARAYQRDDRGGKPGGAAPPPPSPPVPAAVVLRATEEELPTAPQPVVSGGEARQQSPPPAQRQPTDELSASSRANARAAAMAETGSAKDGAAAGAGTDATGSPAQGSLNSGATGTPTPSQTARGRRRVKQLRMRSFKLTYIHPVGHLFCHAMRVLQAPGRTGAAARKALEEDFLELLMPPALPPREDVSEGPGDGSESVNVPVVESVTLALEDIAATGTTKIEIRSNERRAVVAQRLQDHLGIDDPPAAQERSFPRLMAVLNATPGWDTVEEVQSLAQRHPHAQEVLDSLYDGSATLAVHQHHNVEETRELVLLLREDLHGVAPTREEPAQSSSAAVNVEQPGDVAAEASALESDSARAPTGGAMSFSPPPQTSDPPRLDMYGGEEAAGLPSPLVSSNVSGSMEGSAVAKASANLVEMMNTENSGTEGTTADVRAEELGAAAPTSRDVSSPRTADGSVLRASPRTGEKGGDDANAERSPSADAQPRGTAAVSESRAASTPVQPPTTKNYVSGEDDVISDVLQPPDSVLGRAVGGLPENAARGKEKEEVTEEERRRIDERVTTVGGPPTVAPASLPETAPAADEKNDVQPPPSSPSPVPSPVPRAEKSGDVSPGPPVRVSRNADDLAGRVKTFVMSYTHVEGGAICRGWRLLHRPALTAVNGQPPGDAAASRDAGEEARHCLQEDFLALLQPPDSDLTHAVDSARVLFNDTGVSSMLQLHVSTNERRATITRRLQASIMPLPTLASTRGEPGSPTSGAKTADALDRRYFPRLRRLLERLPEWDTLGLVEAYLSSRPDLTELRRRLSLSYRGLSTMVHYHHGTTSALAKELGLESMDSLQRNTSHAGGSADGAGPTETRRDRSGSSSPAPPASPTQLATAVTARVTASPTTIPAATRTATDASPTFLSARSTTNSEAMDAIAAAVAAAPSPLARASVGAAAVPADSLAVSAASLPSTPPSHAVSASSSVVFLTDDEPEEPADAEGPAASSPKTTLTDGAGRRVATPEAAPLTDKSQPRSGAQPEEATAPPAEPSSVEGSDRDPDGDEDAQHNSSPNRIATTAVAPRPRVASDAASVPQAPAEAGAAAEAAKRGPPAPPRELARKAPAPPPLGPAKRVLPPSAPQTPSAGPPRSEWDKLLENKQKRLQRMAYDSMAAGMIPLDAQSRSPVRVARGKWGTQSVLLTLEWEIFMVLYFERKRSLASTKRAQMLVHPVALGFTCESCPGPRSDHSGLALHVKRRFTPDQLGLTTDALRKTLDDGAAFVGASGAAKDSKSNRKAKKKSRKDGESNGSISSNDTAPSSPLSAVSGKVQQLLSSDFEMVLVLKNSNEVASALHALQDSVSSATRAIERSMAAANVPGGKDGHGKRSSASPPVASSPTLP